MFRRRIIASGLWPVGIVALVTVVAVTSRSYVHGSELPLNQSALEKKVDRLIDLEEIKKLRLDYAEFEQSGDVDKWVGLFTKDAVLSYGPEFGGDWKGTDIIRRNYSKWNREAGPPFNTVYVLTNPEITLTSDTSAYGHWTATMYLTKQVKGSLLTTPGGDRAPLYMIAVYEDDYQKVDGRWKIAKLKLHFLWPERSFTGFDHSRRDREGG